MYILSKWRQGVDKDLELEGLLFEEEENKNVFLEHESSENNDNLSERWASWVNIVNR